MSQEIFKFEKEPPEKEPQKKPRSAFQTELEKLGSKVDLMSAGKIEIENYELNPSAILDRWKKVFDQQIRDQQIEEETLMKWAEQFSEESKKIIAWIKEQSDPSKFEITHFINQFGGEHLTIHKKGEVERIYQASMRFSPQGIKLETNKSFLEDKNSV